MTYKNTAKIHGSVPLAMDSNDVDMFTHYFGKIRSEHARKLVGQIIDLLSDERTADRGEFLLSESLENLKHQAS